MNRIISPKNIAFEMNKVISDDDVTTGLVVSRIVQSDKKQNEFEVFFMLVKYQVGPFLLSYPFFYSQAGIIGGLIGFVLGYLITLRGNLMTQSVTNEIEEQNKPLEIKTLQETISYSFDGVLKYIMYYLILAFVILQTMSILTVEMSYIVTALNAIWDLDVYFLKIVSILSNFVIFMLIKNRENLRFVGIISFTLQVILMTSQIATNIFELSGINTSYEKHSSTVSYSWINISQIATISNAVTSTCTMTMFFFLIKYTSKKSVQKNFACWIGGCNTIVCVAVFSLCILTYLSKGNENILPLVTDYYINSIYFNFVLGFYALSVSIFMNVFLFMMQDCLEATSLVKDLIKDSTTGLADNFKNSVLKILFFIVIACIQLLNINLQVIIEYAGVIITIPCTVYIPVAIKHSFEKRAISEQIFDGLFVLLGVLLQVSGFYMAYYG